MQQHAWSLDHTGAFALAGYPIRIRIGAAAPYLLERDGIAPHRCALLSTAILRGEEIARGLARAMPEQFEERDFSGLSHITPIEVGHDTRWIRHPIDRTYCLGGFPIRIHIIHTPSRVGLYALHQDGLRPAYYTSITSAMSDGRLRAAEYKTIYATL